MSCAAHVIFDWIPAFAGMTGWGSTATGKP
jgi:hypothetical protein